MYGWLTGGGDSRPSLDFSVAIDTRGLASGINTVESAMQIFGHECSCRTFKLVARQPNDIISY